MQPPSSFRAWRPRYAPAARDCRAAGAGGTAFAFHGPPAPVFFDENGPPRTSRPRAGFWETPGGHHYRQLRASSAR